ncbi:unnamed protein product [Trichobilharzia regenti]|nr:unnamed protein product [Trichobilharzia regenti]
MKVFMLAVGTNPITLAAPGKKSEDHFVLDMATSAVALGKVSLPRFICRKMDNFWDVFLFLKSLEEIIALFFVR